MRPWLSNWGKLPKHTKDEIADLEKENDTLAKKPGKTTIERG